MEAVGVGRRAVAIIIDMIVLGIIGWILAMFTGMSTPEGFNLVGGPAFLWFFIGLAYYVVMEKQWGGTLGKLALGLRVVKEGGGPIDWGTSIIRNILRIVDGFFFYLVGAIIVWTSKKRQRLGDIVAHTLVVPKG
ncbi:MAG TPA: RDD family protein [Usitatibacter sp.]|nr:RDD family protein [Usitatibacter sp.]